MKKYLFVFLIFAAHLSGQTIAEKKAGLTSTGTDDLSKENQELLGDVNKELATWQGELRDLYKEVMVLVQRDAPLCDFENLLTQINEIKGQIIAIENTWREAVAQGNVEENYSLWHQPDTTLEQLVIDYGAQDYVYLIPPEVGSIRVSINSSVPIPRASWEQMLETILTQNGVGVRQLNPFLRELYLVKQNNSGIRLITNNRRDLDLLPSDARACFVLSPEPSDAKRVWLFLEKFVNPNTTVMQMIGREILIIAPVSDIQDLLKLYDFVSLNSGDKKYKVITLGKVKAEEIAKILGTLFDQLTEAPKATDKIDKAIKKAKDGGDSKPAPAPTTIGGGGEGGLKIITLGSIANAVFLVGTKEEIKKAEEIIRRVEAQVGEARERVIFWYTVKHSEPENLANILTKIYALMIQTGTGVSPKEGTGERGDNVDVNVNTDVKSPSIQLPPSSTQLYAESFYQAGGYVVNPRPIEPTVPKDEDVNKGRENFIVDSKTGSIVMVVEAEILPKLKELIKKLDVPKKMVQIEVLLFEKRMARQSDFGLNLLKIGDCASNKNTTCWTFNDVGAGAENSGVLQFFLSRAKGNSGLPAYDYFYRFLISQQDVQINAAPSVMTINQTPALIAINEEISINTGIFQVDTVGGVTLQNAFTRAQYGINIQVTPTIHMRTDENDLDEVADYITMETEITFDTIQQGGNPQRPDVIRRQVKNNVRIADGQSVIIGGLRRKVKNDDRKFIPFLGEIPGVGKLFSITGLNDTSTELFVIMTPKIIIDPAEDYEKIRRRDLCKRPGDIPQFMCHLTDAQLAEKRRTFEGSMTFLFGRPLDRCVCTEEGEYDGRY